MKLSTRFEGTGIGVKTEISADLTSAGGFHEGARQKKKGSSGGGGVGAARPREEEDSMPMGIVAKSAQATAGGIHRKGWRRATRQGEQIPQEALNFSRKKETSERKGKELCMLHTTSEPGKKQMARRNFLRQLAPRQSIAEKCYESSREIVFNRWSHGDKFMGIAYQKKRKVVLGPGPTRCTEDRNQRRWRARESYIGYQSRRRWDDQRLTVSKKKWPILMLKLSSEIILRRDLKGFWCQREETAHEGQI